VERPLPPYRYVPGLNPHPFRHEGGHLYTDGSPPAEEPWTGTTPWQQDERWLYALDLWDHHFWWEAHEAWEALWHSCEVGTVEHTGLQGLIQAAAARLKEHMGEPPNRLRQAARKRLESVRAKAGTPWRGVDLDGVLAAL